MMPRLLWTVPLPMKKLIAKNLTYEAMIMVIVNERINKLQSMTFSNTIVNMLESGFKTKKNT